MAKKRLAWIICLGFESGFYRGALFDLCVTSVCVKFTSLRRCGIKSLVQNIGVSSNIPTFSLLHFADGQTYET